MSSSRSASSSPDGSELAGRASTFVFVPAGFIAALAVIRLTDNSLRWPIIRADVRMRAPVVVAVAVVAALVLIFNGLVNGWPPYWERLPGPYQVAGVERSVGPEQIASADWALAALGPGNRFATDEGDFPVLGQLRRPEPGARRRRSCTPRPRSRSRLPSRSRR